MTSMFETIQDYLYDLSFGFHVIYIWLASKKSGSLAYSCMRHALALE